MRTSHVIFLGFAIALIINFSPVPSSLIVIPATLIGYLAGTHRKGVFAALSGIIPAELVPFIFYFITNPTGTIGAIQSAYPLLLVDLGFVLAMGVFGALLGISVKRLRHHLISQPSAT